MTTSNTTPNRGYDEPHAGNQLKDDVERLIAAIRAVDGDMATALQSLSERAPINDPSFTGAPEAPTPDGDDDSNRLATTAFVKALLTILTGPNAIAVNSLNMVTALKEFLSSETLATARESLGVPETEAVSSALVEKLDKNGANAGNDAAKSALLAAIGVDTSGAAGDLFYRNAAGLLVPLAKGTAGQKIRQHPTEDRPQWESGFETISSGSFSAATVVDFTNLSAFRQLRLHLSAFNSEESNVYLRTSTDNGANFAAGTSDYSFWLMQHSTIFSSDAGEASGILLNYNAIGANVSYVARIDIFDFNITEFMRTLGHVFYSTETPATAILLTNGRTATTTTRNAFRIVPSTGTITGSYLLEGRRG